MTTNKEVIKGQMISIIEEGNFEKETLENGQVTYSAEMDFDRDDLQSIGETIEKLLKENPDMNMELLLDSLYEELKYTFMFYQDQFEDGIKTAYQERHGELSDSDSELFSSIIEEDISIYATYPKDFFDKIKLNSFFAIVNEDEFQVDFSLNAHFFSEQKDENDYNFNQEEMKASIFLLAKKLGYSNSDIFDGFNDKSDINTKSFESIIEEMCNATNECNILGFPLMLSVNNFMAVKDAKEVELPKGINRLGLFAPFVGGGSLLNIYNQKEFTLNNVDKENYEFKLLIDGQLGYTVSSVYGIDYEEQTIKIVK